MNTSTGRMRRAVILVVDDVEGNRQLVCRRLEPFGYDLHQAESGQQALDFIRSRKPDLVLLDYMMPAMSGIEVLRQMRQDWQIASIPVIMVTARAESTAVVEALDAGADDYVAKPIDFDVLRARIETQLAKRRSSESLRQVNAVLDERATMRVLAFDELKNELEREIIRRRQSELRLEDVQAMIERCSLCGKGSSCSGGEGRCTSPEAMPGALSPTERQTRVTRAVELIDALARAVAAGKPVNPAMLAALRTQVADLG